MLYEFLSSIVRSEFCVFHCSLFLFFSYNKNLDVTFGNFGKAHMSIAYRFIREAIDKDCTCAFIIKYN